MDLHPSENILFSGHPSWRSALTFHFKGLGIAIVVGVIVWFAASHGTGIAAGVAVLAAVVVIGVIRRIATHYVVTNERLHIRRGILSKRTQETRLARVQNVNTDQSVLERLMRIGTVDFDTAGTDDSDFTFYGIANPEIVVQQVDRALREPPPAPPTAAFAGEGTAGAPVAEQPADGPVAERPADGL
ncbi:MAG TPA: PH domain-containing protein [Solirubrobacteraceae bacterium]|nr:PH domain-containing protein [Solirubrobacteraceae bacterium]